MCLACQRSTIAGRLGEWKRLGLIGKAAFVRLPLHFILDSLRPIHISLSLSLLSCPPIIRSDARLYTARRNFASRLQLGVYLGVTFLKYQKCWKISTLQYWRSPSVVFGGYCVLDFDMSDCTTHQIALFFFDMVLFFDWFFFLPLCLPAPRLFSLEDLRNDDKTLCSAIPCIEKLDANLASEGFL